MRGRAEALLGAVGAAVAAYMYQIGALFPTINAPIDPTVALLGARFQAAIDEAASGIAVASKGMFYRDRDMLFWWRFADNFGANLDLKFTRARHNCSCACRCWCSWWRWCLVCLLVVVLVVVLVRLRVRIVSTASSA